MAFERVAAKSKVKSPKPKVARAKSKPVPPGPKPSITLHVVKRVSRRVALGSTLKLALAAEDNPTVNEETWKKALQTHPEFSPHYEAGKGKFLERAMGRLEKSKDLKFLCWLLERRHADLFAKPAAVQLSVSNHTTINGVPDDVMERARKLAREEAKPDGK